eukprot:Nk52_evm1s2402 gene=Nk52_evmTU1s2402
MYFYWAVRSGGGASAIRVCIMLAAWLLFVGPSLPAALIAIGSTSAMEISVPGLFQKPISSSFSSSHEEGITASLGPLPDSILPPPSPAPSPSLSPLALFTLRWRSYMPTLDLYRPSSQSPTTLLRLAAMAHAVGIPLFAYNPSPLDATAQGCTTPDSEDFRVGLIGRIERLLQLYMEGKVPDGWGEKSASDFLHGQCLLAGAPISRQEYFHREVTRSAETLYNTLLVSASEERNEEGIVRASQRRGARAPADTRQRSTFAEEEHGRDGMTSHKHMRRSAELLQESKSTRGAGSFVEPLILAALKKQISFELEKDRHSKGAASDISKHMCRLREVTNSPKTCDGVTRDSDHIALDDILYLHLAAGVTNLVERMTAMWSGIPREWLLDEVLSDMRSEPQLGMFVLMSLPPQSPLVHFLKCNSETTCGPVLRLVGDVEKGLKKKTQESEAEGEQEHRVCRETLRDPLPVICGRSCWTKQTEKEENSPIDNTQKSSEKPPESAIEATDKDYFDGFLNACRVDFPSKKSSQHMKFINRLLSSFCTKEEEEDKGKDGRCIKSDCECATAIPNGSVNMEISLPASPDAIKKAFESFIFSCSNYEKEFQKQIQTLEEQAEYLKDFLQQRLLDNNICYLVETETKSQNMDMIKCTCYDSCGSDDSNIAS